MPSEGKALVALQYLTLIKTELCERWIQNLGTKILISKRMYIQRKIWCAKGTLNRTASKKTRSCHQNWNKYIRY